MAIEGIVGPGFMTVFIQVHSQCKSLTHLISHSSQSSASTTPSWNSFLSTYLYFQSNLLLSGILFLLIFRYPTLLFYQGWFPVSPPLRSLTSLSPAICFLTQPYLLVPCLIYSQNKNYLDKIEEHNFNDKGIQEIL